MSQKASQSDRAALRAAVRRYRKTVYNPKISVKLHRTAFDEVFGTVMLPNNIDRREVVAQGVPADLLVPELAIGGRTILYAHGGGFIAGSRRAARNLCASLAHESASRLLLPEYRLAPEYPFPTALEDLFNAYRWLLDGGTSPSDVVFAGDGTGANLMLSLVHYLQKHRAPNPAAILAISPWVDLSCQTEAFTGRKNPDPLFSRESLAQLATLYTYQDNFKNPLVSPIHGDYLAFPPLYVQCGSREILIDDARALVSRVNAAGGNAKLDVQEGMWHLFQAADALTPRAHLAVKAMGAWVRRGYQ